MDLDINFRIKTVLLKQQVTTSPCSVNIPTKTEETFYTLSKKKKSMKQIVLLFSVASNELNTSWKLFETWKDGKT